MPLTPKNITERQQYVKMDGKAVFRFAVKVLGKTVETSLKKASLAPDAVDYLVPHQANIRIIDSARHRLGIPEKKVIINIQKYGNMSAASIPVALAEAAQQGTFKKGDIVALSGFGAGLTWGSCILKWFKEDKS